MSKASDIQQAWEQQQALVSQIITLRSTLLDDENTEPQSEETCQVDELKQELQTLDQQLAQLHETHLLVSPHVDKNKLQPLSQNGQAYH
ncbi:hypothetical protein J4727_20600 [Providencia rettgeri]|uniref:Uncharacterized protein n=1 Tax=Providencia rettgeri TaxID=587 RepID=A0A939SPQ5_PRORE|nr:hypothetical protein [Providencia rettgeri]